ncbi:MAG TPA: hypothetical protein VK200_11230, partial [Candidatus Limnocylindrales bacterium]|nr:hypothetical protein [Candidatus Limnocylindrales bacterium]
AAIRILPRSEYLAATERTIEFFFGEMFRDGYLLHNCKDKQAKLLGYLDDYAFLAIGLLDVYEVLFDRALLQRAIDLCEIMLREFWDETDGAFFYTGNAHEKLISRAKPIFDASIPSGNSMAVQLLLRLHHIAGRELYLQRAEKVLRSYYDAMESQPFGFAHLTCALDFYLAKPKEILVVGDRQSPSTRDILAGIYSLYLPNMTLQLAMPDEPLEKIAPLLRGKTQVDGRPTVYVCQNYTCSAPVTSWLELKRLLES